MVVSGGGGKGNIVGQIVFLLEIGPDWTDKLKKTWENLGKPGKASI